MLLKSKISEHKLSLDPLLNQEYLKSKLGRFTSSEISNLMDERGISKSAGLNYIFRKVGEYVSGKPSRSDISTEATEHGLKYEREGLMTFGEQMGIDSLLVQRLILDGGRFGGTPDGLIVKGESEDGLSLRVETVELKCPLSFDGYIRLFKCKTPEDLKKEHRKYHYQVIHQMELCGALVGWFVCYHPDFAYGKINIIQYKKIDLVPEFKLLAERKKEAVAIFEETIKELKNK